MHRFIQINTVSIAGLFFALVLIGAGLSHKAVDVDAQTTKPKLFVLTETGPFNGSQLPAHDSIPAGKQMMTELAQQHNYEIVFSENSSQLTESFLSQFNAVVFLNTAGDILNNTEVGELRKYIQAGGGFVGIHAAAFTNIQTPWYYELVGGRMLTHPPAQNGRVNVVDDNHPSTEDLPDSFTIFDEWYDWWEDPRSNDVNLLLTATNYNGGQLNPNPIAWYQEYDGGYSWFTVLGHES